MASIKIKFRPSSVEGKEGAIYYQIIHNRIIRQTKTHYHIFQYEWDPENSKIRSEKSFRTNYLKNINECIGWDIKRFDVIIKLFETKRQSYSADDIMNSFKNKKENQTLCNFMQKIITQLIKMRKYRTSETYSAALKSFMSFRENKDILLDEIDSDTILMYEAYLRNKGLKKNSTSFYMRILRAVYNRAVEKDLTGQRNPFKHVYTGVDKTVKRAISFKAIKKIKELNLYDNPPLCFARDLFLFSFYTRGMSFIDIAYLKKKDLKNGVLTYNRRKTGQYLTVRWEKCMQEIIDKHETDKNNIYLLPILKYPDDNRNQYKNMLMRINRLLKEIAKLINLNIPLTLYVARHSWASIAKSKNIPISVISEGMGHDSELTTQIYLASLDNNIIDNANAKILHDLQEPYI